LLTDTAARYFHIEEGLIAYAARLRFAMRLPARAPAAQFAVTQKVAIKLTSVRRRL
jgi:hypothetical protein